MDTVHTPLSRCLFALASADITPPVGIYHRMWGAAAHDRSEGVHRPLTATALVFGSLTDEAERQALVAIDHCLLLPREIERLSARLAAASALPEERIVVTFSHTHAAGLMDPARSGLPGGDLILPYLEEVFEKAADALGAALGSLRPAIITHAAGRSALAAHRDFLDPRSGAYVCGFDPSTPADDTVLVSRVTALDGALLSTLVNYACHPTTLAFENRLLSPDYPGALRELVAAATGAPCVFLQGASGDLGPREGFVGDPEVADRNGRQLGHAVLSVLESMPPPGTRYRYQGPVVSGATLGIWAHEDLGASGRDAAGRWERRSSTIALPYRAGLPTLEAARRDLARWEEAERDAREGGDAARARDARAMAERARRLAARLEVLPAGRSYPFRLTLWRIGDAFWLALPGEPYSALQRELRRRFPEHALIIVALAGGWGPSYLPSEETYGKGIYQEEIAVVERGSLERLIEEARRQIEEWAG
jgi:hypothetical protein